MAVSNRCFYPGQLLLPREGTNLTAWACVACDQFTSQPAYWEEVERLVGDQPSAFRMILPECWLNETDARVPGICRTMEQYLRDGTLVPAVQLGFILTERITPSGARVGLVGMIDLECYDFHPEAKSLVRASEGTIAERIPPRVRIREKAPLETSHVMLLMDDPMQSVVEPLFQKRRQLRKLYDFPLMMNGGQLVGYAVEDAADIDGVYAALERLRQGDDPMLFAVGDGNHSLATAKAIWDKVKPGLTPEETMTHPARFAMVEIENIYDDALRFEPIHRVLYEGKEVTVSIPTPHRLAVGDLQTFLDEWLPAHPGAKLDYVHGEQAVRDLVKGEGAVGFLLPAPDKSRFFEQVRELGVLPRKTFSMGEANEKRYYMECRRK